MSRFFKMMIFCILSFCLHCVQHDNYLDLDGEYLGQTLPGEDPELFAPGIISRGLYERDVAMMPDGKEIYTGVITGQNQFSAILVTRYLNGRWTKPEVVSFCSDLRYRNLEPFITPDGKKFFFVSNRPGPQSGKGEENWDIWVSDRVGDDWSEPVNLGPPVNTELGEYFPSLTSDGSLYFTRGNQAERTNFIYRSHFVNGRYTEPEKLGPEVNSTGGQFNAYIAPDESYLIVPVFGREDSHGSTDYYVVFRDENDRWSGPFNMGPKVNTASSLEYSPYVSPDGKFFFFMSARRDEDALCKNQKITYEDIRAWTTKPENGLPDIYWVDAGFIQKLKPER